MTQQSIPASQHITADGFILTGIAVVEESGGAATAGQEGQRRCHEPLHDAALPGAETQAAG